MKSRFVCEWRWIKRRRNRAFRVRRRRRSPSCGGISAFICRFMVPTAPSCGHAIREATGSLKPPEGIQWIADVDPVDML